MQNVRSKSTTSTGAIAAPGEPAYAGVCAPQLRIVPGRVALFLVVFATVAMLLAPRLASAASPEAEALEVHVVAAGETLWEVAGRNAGDRDVRGYVDSLRLVNRLTSPVIFPGQELVLP